MKDILSIFYPSYYTKNTYSIDFKKLKELGIKGIIFDIDNTLVPHDAPADKKAFRLIEELKEMGFKLMIVSNNEEPRVKSFADALGCPYVFKALKPAATGYLEAFKKTGLKKEELICIGDQIFTDIWGANRAGLKSILVGRLYPYEPPHIHLKRMLEYPVKLKYLKYRKKRG